ncbi:MAG: radical SAM protein [Candidatus Omnitrophica bacterium]|nr:radical SAM protein [Candidatus Omnitrophota bacterium]MDD5553264.1 radical SAM protein [Candidatus Omnitrophota bacterium]
MKRIILYNPQADLIYWRKGNPPLPLLAVSSILDKEGYEIKILDYRSWDIADAEGALCAGITCMTGYQILDGLNFARKIRQKYPGIPIVWGGRHPTLLPEQTIENEFVDIVVRGQGERTFTELVKAIEAQEGLSGVQGITYKDPGGRIISNPERPFEDVNNFPPLPYHLLKMEEHIARTRMGKRTIGYITSMGCPFHCGFCAEESVFHRRWSGLTADRVVEDIRNLVDKYNVDSVILSDSNFFVNEKRVSDICEGIKGLGIAWGQVNGRTDTLSRYKPQTWRLMRESGLQYILTGAESGLEECLKVIKKEADTRDTLNFTRIAKDHGVRIQFSLFIGTPCPEKTFTVDQELESTLDLIYRLHRMNKDSEFLFFVYAPYPGSPLYEATKQLGFKEPEKFEEWGHFDLNEKHIPWVSDRQARFTWDISYYLFFISGSLHKTINNYPFIARVVLMIAALPFYAIVLFRFKHKFFAVPFEIIFIRLALKAQNNIKEAISRWTRLFR